MDEAATLTFAEDVVQMLPAGPASFCRAGCAVDEEKQLCFLFPSFNPSVLIGDGQTGMKMDRNPGMCGRKGSTVEKSVYLTQIT